MHACSWCTRPSNHRGLCATGPLSFPRKQSTLSKLLTSKITKKREYKTVQWLDREPPLAEQRIDVFWPEFGRYFRGTVSKMTPKGRIHVIYDDNDQKWHDLTKMEFIVVPEPPIAGTRLNIYWEGEKKWYSGIVQNTTSRRGTRILYDDGDVRWHHLHRERVEYVSSLETLAISILSAHFM